MKVTVQSPFSAELDIVQMTAWLHRGGWVATTQTTDSRRWINRQYASAVDVPLDGCVRMAHRMSETVERIAEELGRLPGDILREMSEVVP